MGFLKEKTNWELLRNGIFGENTIFRMAISLCPAIAVTSSLKTGLALGASVVFVQTMVNVTVSAIRKFIHPKIRIPIFMFIIAGWVTVIDLTMSTFFREIYAVIGLYIQIIVAFASIFARAEVFASKNKIPKAFFDGLGSGLGFLMAMLIISFFRELLGKGTLFGFEVVAAKPLLIMVLPSGGFIAVGLLMAFFNWVDIRFFGGKGASGV